VAAVLFEEVVEELLGQARDEDGFVVRDQLHIEEIAVEVEHDEQVDRGTREARQRGHGFGLEDESRFGAAGIEQLPHALVVELFAEAHRRHDVGFDGLACQGVGGVEGSRDDREAGQQQ